MHHYLTKCLIYPVNNVAFKIYFYKADKERLTFPLYTSSDFSPLFFRICSGMSSSNDFVNHASILPSF